MVLHIVDLRLKSHLRMPAVSLMLGGRVQQPVGWHEHCPLETGLLLTVPPNRDDLRSRKRQAS
jgi:hypothetical protein